MDVESGLIFAVDTKSKDQCGGDRLVVDEIDGISNRCEWATLETMLTDGNLPEIASLTTDKSTSVSSKLASGYPHIKHSIDLWHTGKRIVKALKKVCYNTG